jgi:hypothetical protein
VGESHRGQPAERPAQHTGPDVVADAVELDAERRGRWAGLMRSFVAHVDSAISGTYANHIIPPMSQ